MPAHTGHTGTDPRYAARPRRALRSSPAEWTQDTDNTVIEIADGIYRLSTCLDPPGMGFNQFLVVDEEPLVFHLGHRRLFPQVHEALGRAIDPCRVPGALAHDRAQPRRGPPPKTS